MSAIRKLVFVLLAFHGTSLIESTTTAPKPGLCPKPVDNQMGICVHNCNNDSDCSGSKKCCKLACGGMDCITLAPPPPQPTKAAISTTKPTKVGPTQRKGCPLPNGNVVPDGLKFQTNGGCTWCTCRNGIPSCTYTPGCVPSSRPNVPTPYQCKPGEVYHPSPCTDCTCKLDKFNNIISDCSTINCALPLCPSGYRLSFSPDKCCPSCAPASTGVPPTGKSASCLYFGRKFAHGQSFLADDGCNNCFCSNGYVGCTKKLCHNSCASVLCKQGYVCEEQQVQCIKAPCYPIPKCVPAPTPSSKPVCPLVSCPDLMYCQYGYMRDSSGCFMCSCNIAPTAGPTLAPCPLPNCLPCQHGYAIDSDSGCRGCQCVPKSSSKCDVSDFQKCFQDDIVSKLLLTGNTASRLPQVTCQALQKALTCSRSKRGLSTLAQCSSIIKTTLSYNSKMVNKLISNFCSKSRCIAGGISYPVNSSYPSADGCNTCYCLDDGSSACTLMACEKPGCRYGGVSHASGDDFPALDGCNTCSCKMNVVTCARSTCTKTRYLKTTVVFDEDLKKIIPDENTKGRFKTQFKKKIGEKLQMSEAQITIMSITEGSIIVTFAVESPQIQDAKDQLQELIESEEFIISFDNYNLIADNLDYSAEEQTGTLPEDGGDSDDSGNNVGLIVGVVCGSLAFIAVIVVIVIVMTKKKSSKTVSYDNNAYEQVKESKVNIET